MKLRTYKKLYPVTNLTKVEPVLRQLSRGDIVRETDYQWCLPLNQTEATGITDGCIRAGVLRCGSVIGRDGRIGDSAGGNYFFRLE